MGGLDDDWDQEASLAATVAEIEAAHASGLITLDELDEDDVSCRPMMMTMTGAAMIGAVAAFRDGPIEEPAVAADGTGRGDWTLTRYPGAR